MSDQGERMGVRIVGNGAMGSAVEEGLAVSRQRVIIAERSAPLEGTTSDEILLLAVKPQDLKVVSEAYQAFDGLCVVSVLAGVTTAQLKEHFSHVPVVRMMPNLAVRYGDGIVALAENLDLEPLREELERVFASLGMVRWFPEERMDAVTALCGSGPAFVCALVEGMVEAGLGLGFTPEESEALVQQMVGGSLTLLYEAPESPKELYERIASPGGTTQAGLQVLEKHQVKQALLATFQATLARAKQMEHER